MDLLQGTLDMLVLRTLMLSPLHGYAIAKAIITAAGPSAVLKDDARMTTSHSRLLASLVSAQVALSLLLLIGAGLFLRTLQNLQNLDPGFKREGVLVLNLEGRRSAFPSDLLADLQRVPGVVSASVSTHSPLNGSTWSEAAVPQGQPVPENDNAFFIGAGPRFFETMQTPLLAGREFTQYDTKSHATVAVINEAYAARYFPGRSPVGQHLSTGMRGHTDLKIVGVVRNSHLAGFRSPPPATVYVAYAQLPGESPTTIAIRAAGSLAQVASAIRNELQARVPNALIEVGTLSAQVDGAMVRERMMATLAGAFGVLALMLACVGLYGLLTYSVVRRTKEMGIRMALGARPRSLVILTVKSAVGRVAIGMAVGLPVAWAASRSVQAMLFGLTPTDPVTFGSAALLLLARALFAAYLPARRASRVDPMTALRHE